MNSIKIVMVAINISKNNLNNKINWQKISYLNGHQILILNIGLLSAPVTVQLGFHAMWKLNPKKKKKYHQISMAE